MHFLFFFAFPANLSSLTKWRVIAVQQKPKQHRAQARQHTDRPYLKRETKRDEETKRNEETKGDGEIKRRRGTMRYEQRQTNTQKERLLSRFLSRLSVHEYTNTLVH